MKFTYFYALVFTTTLLLSNTAFPATAQEQQLPNSNKLPYELRFKFQSNIDTVLKKMTEVEEALNGVLNFFNNAHIPANVLLSATEHGTAQTLIVTRVHSPSYNASTLRLLVADRIRDSVSSTSPEGSSGNLRIFNDLHIRLNTFNIFSSEEDTQNIAAPPVSQFQGSGLFNVTVSFKMKPGDFSALGGERPLVDITANAIDTFIALHYDNTFSTTRLPQGMVRDEPVDIAFWMIFGNDARPQPTINGAAIGELMIPSSPINAMLPGALIDIKPYTLPTPHTQKPDFVPTDAPLIPGGGDANRGSGDGGNGVGYSAQFIVLLVVSLALLGMGGLLVVVVVRRRDRFGKSSLGSSSSTSGGDEDSKSTELLSSTSSTTSPALTPTASSNGPVLIVHESHDQQSAWHQNNSGCDSHHHIVQNPLLDQQQQQQLSLSSSSMTTQSSSSAAQPASDFFKFSKKRLEPHPMPTSHTVKIDEALVIRQAEMNCQAWTIPFQCASGHYVEKSVSVVCDHCNRLTPKRVTDLKTYFGASIGHVWKCASHDEVTVHAFQEANGNGATAVRTGLTAMPMKKKDVMDTFNGTNDPYLQQPRKLRRIDVFVEGTELDDLLGETRRGVKVFYNTVPDVFDAIAQCLQDVDHYLLKKYRVDNEQKGNRSDGSSRKKARKIEVVVNMKFISPTGENINGNVMDRDHQIIVLPPSTPNSSSPTNTAMPTTPMLSQPSSPSLLADPSSPPANCIIRVAPPQSAAGAPGAPPYYSPYNQPQQAPPPPQQIPLPPAGYTNHHHHHQQQQRMYHHNVL